MKINKLNESLIDKLNSLPYEKGISKVSYELIKEYQNILNQFPLGTVLKHYIDAGEEKFTKVEDGEFSWWEYFRAPWKDNKRKSEFDLARWLAGRGVISRSDIIEENLSIMKINKLNESTKFKVNDKVFVKPNKKQGRVLKVKGDYITVEMDDGKNPVRIDTYYDTDLEAVDEITESKQLNETKDGKDELWNQINNNEWAYNILANKVKTAVEKGLPKERIINIVRNAIASMKNDFGRCPTTQAERLELARDFVEDELQGYSFEDGDPDVPSYKRTGTWKKLGESFNPANRGIQYVKCYNQYNYTIQELRVDNDNKTFERGQFTMGKPDKKTKNRQEFEDIVDTLKELGYTEIKSDYHSMRNKSRKGIPTNESIDVATTSDDKRKALANYLDVDVEDVVQTYDENNFEVQSTGEEYIVADYDTAYDLAEQDVISTIDDLGIAAFTPYFQEWIMDYAVDEDWFKDALVESQRYYYEDMDEDEFVEVCEENNISPDDDNAIDELVDIYLDGIDDYVDEFKSIFGDSEFSTTVKENDLIDLDKVVEEAIRVDGIAHFIAGYDGEEIELNDDLFAYRTN